MFIRMFCISSVVAMLFNASLAQAQEKQRTGTVTGEVKSTKVAPNGKNQILEVLAPGEAKPRTYRVVYDPTIKAPKADVLEKVRAAKVGDKVRLEWIMQEGFAITSFEVLGK